MDGSGDAVQAIAETIALRLARHTGLVSDKQKRPTVVVNGAVLAKRATTLGTRPMASVGDTARAAGWAMAWDPGTGTIDLTRDGKPTVRLLAGSSEVRVGGQPAPNLKNLVLKNDGEPVIDIEELAPLLGGSVIAKTADRVDVRL